jgi:glucose/arabinose dehydrogenase
MTEHNSARSFARAPLAAGLLLSLGLLLLLWNLPANAQAGAVRLELVAGALEQPLLVTHAGDGSGRLFVVEKTGRIKIIQNGQVLATPFLDIRDRVGTENESGLLSVAFPASYAQDGYFFVYYSHKDKNLVGPEAIDAGNNSGHDTVVARFRVSTGNPNVADPAGEERILIRNQPYVNHNGGMMAFGQDGYLYIALGDGGSGGDPQRQAQNLGTLLGKMLRIAVGASGTYTIPPR